MKLAALLLCFSAAAHAAATGYGPYDATADIVLDGTTHLVWQRAPAPSAMTHADADAYCRKLSLGGYASGWRLPTFKELLSIFVQSECRSDISRAGIDASAFPGAFSPSSFWAATPALKVPGSFWSLNFIQCTPAATAPEASFSVRCVH